jgi:hypothetical protein
MQYLADRDVGRVIMGQVPKPVSTLKSQRTSAVVSVVCISHRTASQPHLNRCAYKWQWSVSKPYYNCDMYLDVTYLLCLHYQVVSFL